MIIQICNCDRNSPVMLVVELKMPLNFDWAHMARALDKRRDDVLLAWTWNMR